uniref:Uncharacterized protein n=1 Tax=Arundo donax TaxID=35708 RepID=A0A0A8ZW27_ARUDO
MCFVLSHIRALLHIVKFSIIVAPLQNSGDSQVPFPFKLV